jgi:hypothetical protein
MKNWNRTAKILVFAPVGIAAVALFTFLIGEIVRRLWNWLLPAVFGLPAITFWQAIGLLVLARILFGGFGGRSGHRNEGIRARVVDRIADRVADRVSERLEGLSPEERERFTQRLRQRWGATPTSKQDTGN